jgi:hemolysin activation/secretion protein
MAVLLRFRRARGALCIGLGLLFGVCGPMAASARTAWSDADASAPRYTIRQVLVQGASVYKPDLLKAVYAPVLTQPVSEDDVEAVAEALADYYRRGGYFLATAGVPKQRLDYGLLVLHVAEGDITSVRIEGDAALYTAPLRAAVERLVAVHPMTEPAFTQAMAAFAAVKTMATTVKFVPDATGEGHYRMVLDLRPRAPAATQASGAADTGAAKANPVVVVSAADAAIPGLLDPGPPPDGYRTAAPRTPSIGPFYLPRPDGREDAYALLDHGPGWYKRSEDGGVFPALGLRLGDHDGTKVGFEAGVPRDDRVDRGHGDDDDVQLMFTVDRHF